MEILRFFLVVSGTFWVGFIGAAFANAAINKGAASTMLKAMTGLALASIVAGNML